MCGIAGKYNALTEEPVAAELINAMCDRIAYRGPDDAGVYTDGGVGLGHLRLSIIDLSPLGHQPMGSADERLWITFNGEIYNFQALREELLKKGYRFKSNGDTEVILYLYREYGDDCVRHLRGMFAFAIWDKDNRRLFLARDRIGKKPLFYHWDGKHFIFASEIKAILADPVVRREIDYEALCDYFKYLYVPDPKTIFRNIFKLKPGHCLVCSPEGVTEKEYWDVSFARIDRRPLDELAGELLGTLRESVRLRMISDVPLGAFLSGGIDSSGVVALMAGQQNGPVTTCSIGFDSEAYDEVRFARTIASRFNTDHYEFTVKQKAEPILKRLAFHFDEPFADASAVPTYYVSQLARQRVTVALSGDGGDENFAGYEKYFIDDIENRCRRSVPAAVRRAVFPAASRFLWDRSSRLLQRAATLLSTLSHEADYGFYLTNSDFEDRLWNRLAGDELKRRIGGYDPSWITRYHYRKADTDSHLSRILYTDLKTYLPGDILVKVDRMSMAHSLEVRAPILDHHVVEYAAAIPPDLKYNRGEKKCVLKRAFSRILPDEVMYRKKMGFSVPLADWLRGELKWTVEKSFFSPAAALGYFFNIDEVRRIWNQHLSGRRNHATVLWALLMFELWHEEFMG
jgi:asparagine synthase (glutamine-hydrolysing)